MQSVSNDKVNEFVRACHRIGERRLARCSSGNLSLRLECGRFLVSCSRSWMSRMCADDVSLCRVSDGALLDGRKPTVESTHIIQPCRGDIYIALQGSKGILPSLIQADTWGANISPLWGCILKSQCPQVYLSVYLELRTQDPKFKRNY